MQNGESFLGEKHGKIAHWAKIRPLNYPWLKPNLPNWINMDEMFDLGIITKTSH